MVECLLAKEDVASSSLVSRSIFESDWSVKLTTVAFVLASKKLLCPVSVAAIVGVRQLFACRATEGDEALEDIL